MCDLTDPSPQSFPMTPGEKRLARMMRRFTQLDVRDIKTFRCHVNAWVVGIGWIRTTDLLRMRHQPVQA